MTMNITLQDLTLLPLVTAARNSMQNASAAIQLGITNPVRSYNEIVNQFKDKYAGNSLYKKVMTEAVDEASLLRSVESPNFCFAAGTLVHTKDGLKPIEQIKLGDWVLSKPEGGSGEQAYKRVTRTVSFEDKEIWLVRFYKSGDDIEQIGVTANHPFWLANGGWTRADQLGMGSVIELADLSLGDILCSTPLYKTEKEGVALAYRAWGLEDVDGAMSEVDLIDAEIVVSEENYFSAENQRFTGKVFNLEVEDFHTYYVGAKGVWVHNTNCGDIGVAQIEAQFGVRPSPKTRVYSDGTTEVLNLPGENKGVIFVVESNEEVRRSPGSGLSLLYLARILLWRVLSDSNSHALACIARALAGLLSRLKVAIS